MEVDPATNLYIKSMHHVVLNLIMKFQTLLKNLITIFQQSVQNYK